MTCWRPTSCPIPRWCGSFRPPGSTPGAPQPSVETLLHAFLPYPAVQHSHADPIVTLTNLVDGAARVREALVTRWSWFPT